MRSTVGWIVRGSAIIAALLATLQPVLGSFSLFRGSDLVNYETIHLIVGGILYNFVLLMVLLAPFTKFRRRWTLFTVCLLQYLLLHLQFGLGFGSNENGGLLAYHIPVGVLIFFLAYLTVALCFGLQLRASEA